MPPNNPNGWGQVITLTMAGRLKTIQSIIAKTKRKKFQFNFRFDFKNQFSNDFNSILLYFLINISFWSFVGIHFIYALSYFFFCSSVHSCKAKSLICSRTTHLSNVTTHTHNQAKYTGNVEIFSNYSITKSVLNIINSNIIMLLGIPIIGNGIIWMQVNSFRPAKNNKITWKSLIVWKNVSLEIQQNENVSKFKIPS